MKYIVKPNILSTLLLLSFFVVSCNTEEGEGGKSTVQGKVYKVLHPSNSYSLVNDSLILEADTFPASKEDVYIVYGDQPIYGDKMETGYDGFYRFEYLTKGTYKVYAYSSLTSGAKQAVWDTVSVSSGKTSTCKDIYIHEGKSYLSSYIKGIVQVRHYYKSSGDYYYTAYAAGYDQRVYIRHIESSYQFDEVRTGVNGVFVFQNLQPGTYVVWTYTEAPVTETLIPVADTVSVSNVGQIKSLSKKLSVTINS